MDRNLILAILGLIILSTVAQAASDGSNIYSTPSLQVQLFNYDPIPVNPGTSFSAWFKIINNGTVETNNASAELKLDYPFYLDSGTTNPIKIGQIKVGEVATIQYRINVKPDALDGNRNITLRYYTENGGFKEQNYTIDVAKVTTDFEITVQDATTDLITLGIANVGKNTAKTVTLKTTGLIETSNNLGTMNTDNYTIIQVPVKTNNQENKINAEISYTDLNGNRQTITKQITVDNIQTSVDFDAIIQDISTTGISLGIANVGKNTANSVTVKTDGSRKASFLLGNLNAGDYSVVVVPTGQMNFTLNASGFRRNQTNENMQNANPNILSVDISYTTINGYRKTITKEVRLDSASSTRSATTMIPTQTTGTNWWMWISLASIAGIIYMFYTKRKND